jgi:hypothetical protein
MHSCSSVWLMRMHVFRERQQVFDDLSPGRVLHVATDRLLEHLRDLCRALSTV